MGSSDLDRREHHPTVGYVCLLIHQSITENAGIDHGVGEIAVIAEREARRAHSVSDVGLQCIGKWCTTDIAGRALIHLPICIAEHTHGDRNTHIICPRRQLLARPSRPSSADIQRPHSTSDVAVVGSTTELPSSQLTQSWKRVPLGVEAYCESRQTMSFSVVILVLASQLARHGDDGVTYRAWMGVVTSRAKRLTYMVAVVKHIVSL